MRHDGCTQFFIVVCFFLIEARWLFSILHCHVFLSKRGPMAVLNSSLSYVSFWMGVDCLSQFFIVVCFFLDGCSQFFIVILFFLVGVRFLSLLHCRMFFLSEVRRMLSIFHCRNSLFGWGTMAVPIYHCRKLFLRKARRLFSILYCRMYVSVCGLMAVLNFSFS